MKCKFTKMQTNGNDYLLFDCMKSKIQNPENLAIILSRRRYSVGADGIIVVLPSKKADAKIRVFNADGTEEKFLGNALICAAKYVYDKKIIHMPDMKIETENKICDLILFEKFGENKVSVDMGKIEENESFSEILLKDKKLPINSVVVGNLRCVIFGKNLEILDVFRFGPFFENNEIFPEKVDVDFVLKTKDGLKIRTYKRGVGEVFSSGNGACAATFVAIKKGLAFPSTPIVVETKGGSFEVVSNSRFCFSLTASPKTVFEGVFEEDF